MMSKKAILFFIYCVQLLCKRNVDGLRGCLKEDGRVWRNVRLELECFTLSANLDILRILKL